MASEQEFYMSPTPLGAKSITAFHSKELFERFVRIDSYVTDGPARPSEMEIVKEILSKKTFKVEPELVR